MTHRERIIRALNFEESDRVPIDFGGSVNTSIVAEAYDNFKNTWALKSKILYFSTRLE